MKQPNAFCWLPHELILGNAQNEQHEVCKKVIYLDNFCTGKEENSLLHPLST